MKKMLPQRLCAWLLACVMILGLCPAALAADGDGQDAAADHVMVNQVYGGSDDGVASHSFIELYNPTSAPVDMSGWSVQYRSSTGGDHSNAWEKLNLTGTIGAEDYYLIRCGAITDTQNKSYDVPEGNQEWNIQLHNKGLSVALVDNQTLLEETVTGDVSGNSSIIDVAACAGNDYGKKGDFTTDAAQVPPAWEGGNTWTTSERGLQSKKNAIRRVNFVDTDNSAADFEEVNYSETVGVDKGPHKGSYVPAGSSDPTPSPAERKQAVGFENESASLKLAQIGRYNSGVTDKNGGVMEIVDYNKANNTAYAVNGHSGVIVAIPMTGMTKGQTAVSSLPAQTMDAKSLVDGFTYGDMTSVAVSPDGKTLAVAIQAQDYTENGCVALFTCKDDGFLAFEKAVEVGVQPDMVTFTPDGSKILTANEGEPRQGYGAGAVDPKGSVSVITVSAGTVKTVDFTAFDSAEARAKLVAKQIVLKKGAAPSEDLEPEYIACDDHTAYITCQEANAIAVLDLDTNTFTDICSVGFEDYSKIPVDIDKDGSYDPRNYNDLMGIRMPDAISLYQANGTTYLLTANEGDSRTYADEKGDNSNEDDRKLTSADGKETAKKVRTLNASQYDGLTDGVDYLFGGRTFTVFQVTDSGLEEVYNSGSDFERLTAQYLPEYFNCSNDDVEMDSRSNRKGPEPETVTTGTVGDKTYAFITLERIGGVMVYDITDPAKISYVNYINSRDFVNVDSDGVGLDDSPEGLKFVPAASSPTGSALLLAACEVGGTVAVYELTGTTSGGDSGSHGGGSSRPYYTVSVSGTIANGSVSVSPTSARQGGTVTVTVTPDKGYALETLTALDKNGRELTLVKKSDAQYTFSMPASNVTVAATFTDDNTMLNFFVDVKASDYFYDAVLWAAQKGITAGTDETHFSPNQPCTRAQIVTFLWREAGSPVVNYAMNMTDVPEGAYYAEAVRWALSEGITTGTSDTTFGPNASCTRAQAVTFLCRSQKAAAEGGMAVREFNDFDSIPAYAVDAIQWALENHVTTGVGSGNFAPNAPCTRAQIVTFLYRAAQSK